MAKYEAIATIFERYRDKRGHWDTRSMSDRLETDSKKEATRWARRNARCICSKNDPRHFGRYEVNALTGFGFDGQLSDIGTPYKLAVDRGEYDHEGHHNGRAFEIGHIFY